jgi:hypothetical protein
MNTDEENKGMHFPEKETAENDLTGSLAARMIFPSLRCTNRLVELVTSRKQEEIAEFRGINLKTAVVSLIILLRVVKYEQ